MVRYNWELLKHKYLLSKEKSLQTFLKSQGVIWSGNSRNKTKNWVKEKEELIESSKELALETTKKKLAKIYTPSEKELSQAYSAVFGTLRLKAISNYQKIKQLPDGTIIIPPDVSMTETKTMWEMIKTEKGEPTRIQDKGEFIPEGDEDQEDVQFYLPDNQREGQS